MPIHPCIPEHFPLVDSISSSYMALQHCKSLLQIQSHPLSLARDASYLFQMYFSTLFVTYEILLQGQNEVSTLCVK